MKILIAGVNGNIGSELYRTFKKKFKIISTSFNHGNIKNKFIKLDLTDSYQVLNFTKGCNNIDVLIFLVGLAHSKGRKKEYIDFKKVNYDTLVNLLSSFKKNKNIPSQIIFASTISVYGEKLDQIIYKENLVGRPYSPYAITKLKAEKYLSTNFSDKSWILRFAPVYSSSFLLNIYRRTKIGFIPYRVGNGSNKLSLCNIKNINKAVEGIIEGKVPAGIYNISDSKDYTYDELNQFLTNNWLIRIPKFAVMALYKFGKFVDNAFIKENAIKLISDNIFSSEKIISHINLDATINDI
jgi:nucleoside-diphosphate-sugar epimerase